MVDVATVEAEDLEDLTKEIEAIIHAGYVGMTII
jgi:hypothetical protein